jgi:hypothetical protein
MARLAPVAFPLRVRWSARAVIAVPGVHQRERVPKLAVGDSLALPRKPWPAPAARETMDVDEEARSATGHGHGDHIGLSRTLALLVPTFLLATAFAGFGAPRTDPEEAPQ